MNAWLPFVIDGTRIQAGVTISTNNGTERVFRALDEEVFHNLVNQSVSQLVTHITGFYPDGTSTAAAGLFEVYGRRVVEWEQSKKTPADKKRRDFDD